jgi:hypothetical protein
VRDVICEETIKIGFVNFPDTCNWEIYRECFDLLVVNDGNLCVVEKILRFCDCDESELTDDCIRDVLEDGYIENSV